MSETTVKVIDPVCKMEFKIEKAVAQTEYRGKTYHFCTNACLRQFEENPDRYIDNE